MLVHSCEVETHEMLPKEVIVSESFLLKDAITSETDRVIVTKMGTGKLVVLCTF